MYEKINLWPNDSLPKAVTLQNFKLVDGDKFPAMLILPGGGYAGCSNQEGAPVAGWLNSLGISAFVLDYSVAPSQYPQPLMDARRAIQYLRHNAEELNIDPKRIGVIGFSAGGHLAANLSNSHHENNQNHHDELEKVSARPDLCVLAYPVISWGKFLHQGSKDNLLGENPTPSLLEKTSMENAVSANTPNTFMWHTAEDIVVPVENAYLYAMALQKHKIRHELHVYPDGEHGVGLGTIDHRRNDHYNQWRQACEKWLFQEGF